MKIHPVFHISLLEPAPKDVPLERNLELEKDADEYEVERILDSRVIKNKIQYLIKWKNYLPEENTWELFNHLINSINLVEEFHRQNPGRPFLTQLRS